jgi:hypothetical protein
VSGKGCLVRLSVGDGVSGDYPHSTDVGVRYLVILCEVAASMSGDRAIAAGEDSDAAPRILPFAREGHHLVKLLCRDPALSAVGRIPDLR